MNEISISVGGALGLGVVAVRMIHATIIAETEKSYQVKCGKHTCWLPKKALIKPESIPGLGELHYVKLAQWFKPEDYTEWFLSHYSEVSGQSAC